MIVYGIMRRLIGAPAEQSLAPKKLQDTSGLAYPQARLGARHKYVYYVYCCRMAHDQHGDVQHLVAARSKLGETWARGLAEMCGLQRPYVHVGWYSHW